MATFNFFLRDDKQDESNRCPVYLRLYAHKTSKYYSTGIKVKSADWNGESQRVRSSDPRHAVYNNELDRISIKTQALHFEQRNNGGIKLDRIVQALKGPGAKDFFEYADTFLARIEKEESVRKYKQSHVIINKIEDFYGSRTGLMLSDLDHSFLVDLEAHLANEYDNAPNTIRKDFERLKMLFRAARRDGLLKTNPLEDYDLPKKQKSKKTVLHYSQIQDLESLELEVESVLWHTRNYFLFSFYNAGIRFGDICKLKRRNIIDGRLKYLMDKTRNNSDPKYKSIRLLPKAMNIIEQYNFREKGPDEYLFPIVDLSKNLDDPFVWDREKQSKTAIANRALKELAELAGIEENISTHVARHSFANYARKQGMSLYSISKAMGHSKLATTEQYLQSFDEEMLDGEMDELF